MCIFIFVDYKVNVSRGYFKVILLGIFFNIKLLAVGSIK